MVATPGAYYATSDSLGNYSLIVDTGGYDISQIPISSHRFTDSVTCPSSNEYSVFFSSTDSVIDGLDFVNDYNSCHIIEVGYGISESAICDSVRLWQLEICNNGEAVASNVSAIIQYPGRMIPLYSSMPWTTYNPIDSIMVFDLGELLPDSCINIFITDSVTCVQPNWSFSEAPYNYSAQVLPLNVCYTSDTTYNYSSQSTQIEYFIIDVIEQPTQDEISVYPNPVTSQLYFKGISSGLMEVYNVLGQLLRRTEVKRTVNMSDLASGLYVLKIFDSDERLLKTTKVMVSE
ncbi:MAG: T9SS type A sorting domain-containing protein [Flavobacteriales bacterium]|nr:T9SS type A sorting domain-containing protein [Flavobacteriales bacterium]